MGELDVLRSSIRFTHDNLAARLDTASVVVDTPDQPRKGYEHVDIFLAAASKHLNAVDAVILPEVSKRLPDAKHLVHDYLQSAKGLEIALAQAKAHVYGSVFEARHPWDAVWSDVAEALSAHRGCETGLVDALTEQMPDAELDALTERLHRAESSAPSRPHPYTPHTGVVGLVVRRVMHVVDAFWDMAEGRMVPEPSRPARKRPGRFTQYLLADPRFDEEEPTKPSR